MALSLHTLKPNKGARTGTKRVGRGNASGRGTTAGRGTKGQRARTGGRNRLKLKGLKQMLLAFPKQRGFTTMFPEVYDVRLGRIAQTFPNGAKIDVRSLKSKQLVPRSASFVKIVAGGKLDKALHVKEMFASASVIEAITKAGGSFSNPPKGRRPNRRSAKKSR